MSKTKTKELTRKDLIMHQSGNFLCENLPDNYDEMEDAELHEYIMDNVWQPFEYWRPQEIWENIENAADALIMFLEKQGIKVKK